MSRRSESIIIEPPGETYYVQKVPGIFQYVGTTLRRIRTKTKMKIVCDFYIFEVGNMCSSEKLNFVTTLYYD